MFLDLRDAEDFISSNEHILKQNNMKHLKIVEFANGKFAIQRGGMFSKKEYLELRSSIGDYWWTPDNSYFKDCLGTFEECKKLVDSMTKIVAEPDPLKVVKTYKPDVEKPMPVSDKEAENAIAFHRWMQVNDTPENAERWFGYSDMDMYNEYMTQQTKTTTT